VAAGALEPREDVDQVHLVGRLLDAALQGRDGLVFASGRVEEVRELGVGGDLLLVVGRLDRLRQRLLAIVEARLPEVAAEKARVGGVVLVAGIGGEDLEPGLLGLVEDAALPERVRQRAHPRGFLRLDLDRLAEGLEGLVGALQGVERLPAHQRARGVGRLALDDEVGLLERFLELTGQDRELGELELRRVVLRVEPHRLAELPEAFANLPPAQVRVRELVVGVGVVGIDLQGAAILDLRLGNAPGLLVLLAAREVLLQLRRVVLAARRDRQRERQDRQDS